MHGDPTWRGGSLFYPGVRVWWGRSATREHAAEGARTMEQPALPSHEAASNRMPSGQPHTHRQRGVPFAVGLRTRSIVSGIVAAALLTLLIAIGSRGFHWFDAALIGYAVAKIFAKAAVTYKYTFWPVSYTHLRAHETRHD